MNLKLYDFNFFITYSYIIFIILVTTIIFFLNNFNKKRKYLINKSYLEIEIILYTCQMNNIHRNVLYTQILCSNKVLHIIFYMFPLKKKMNIGKEYQINTSCTK